MAALELAIFILALAGIWWVRRQQLRSLEQQRLLLQRFADGVAAWRNKPKIPEVARQAIEALVDMPMNKTILRRYAAYITLCRPQPTAKLDENPFGVAKQQLDSEILEAFNYLLIIYFLAFTYSDWLSGAVFRRYAPIRRCG